MKCCEKKCPCGLSYTYIPASLGGEFTPEKGAFCNAIVEYGDTGAIYIYSAEGIPVLIKEGNGS